MRAPGEAPGLMALEIAMDEMAEKLGMDPIAVSHALNDTQVDPEKPEQAASRTRPVDQVHAGRRGAIRMEHRRTAKPAPGAGWPHWLVGMGMAAARSATT